VEKGYHPWFSHLISIETIPDTAEAKNEHYRQLLMPPGSKLSSKPENKDALDRLLRDLPHPFTLEDMVSDLRKNMTEFLNLHRGDPSRYPKPLLGEVGLDQSFRVPFGTSAESDLAHISGGSRLSPFFVPVEHQRRILEAQIDLAIEMGVNVSLHSVKSPAPTQTMLKTMLERHGANFDAISVDMHSIGVSVDTWRDIEVGAVHFS
jgi:Tat protein secretion system quality control protein TatD with DNase activity